MTTIAILFRKVVLDVRASDRYFVWEYRYVSSILLKKCEFINILLKNVSSPKKVFIDFEPAVLPRDVSSSKKRKGLCLVYVVCRAVPKLSKSNSSGICLRAPLSPGPSTMFPLYPPLRGPAGCSLTCQWYL